jgi:hypothetical protein
MQAQHRDDFLRATISDYDDEKGRHELEYENGQVMWIDLQERVFKLDNPNDQGGDQQAGGDSAASLLSDSQLEEEQEQRMDELRVNVPAKGEIEGKEEPTWFSFGGLRFFGGVK